MRKFIFITILYSLTLIPAKSQVPGQERPEKFVQVSGIITDDLHRPVQGVAVVSRKLKRGIISERTGIYSLTSTPGDTIFFRALGFKRYHTIIPESYESKHVMVDIVLEPDTISIEEVTILPWKTYSEFLRDVTKEQPVDPIAENMNENIASIYVAITNNANLNVSPEAGYRYSMEQNFSNMATRGQYPVNNLLNPLAWSKFIGSVKNGLFRDKSVKKPEPAKVIKKKKAKKK